MHCNIPVQRPASLVVSFLKLIARQVLQPHRRTTRASHRSTKASKIVRLNTALPLANSQPNSSKLHPVADFGCR